MRRHARAVLRMWRRRRRLPLREWEGLHDRLVGTLGAHLPRAEEWQVRDLAEIVERGAHSRSVHPLSQALAQLGLGGGR